MNLAACASLSQGSSEKGQITVYSALDDKQIDPYLRLFKESHPEIKINLVRGSTGEITKRLLAERDNPKADAVWGLAVTSLMFAEWHEILKPYAPEGLERVSPNFRDSANPPHWVGIDLWMSIFCVNTDLLKELGLPTPQSWQDLIDPAYQGYILMPNPNKSGTGYLAVSAVIQLYGDMRGWDYLDKFHDNVADYTDSGVESCERVASSEYPIAISYGNEGIRQKASGKPVETIFPTEGSGWEMEANALIDQQQIKPAAKTFLDWAISYPVMKLYAQHWAVTSIKTDQPVPEGYPEDPRAQLIDNAFPWAAANRLSILAEWKTRYAPTSHTDPDAEVNE